MFCSAAIFQASLLSPLSAKFNRFSVTKTMNFVVYALYLFFAGRKVQRKTHTHTHTECLVIFNARFMVCLS